MRAGVPTTIPVSVTFSPPATLIPRAMFTGLDVPMHDPQAVRVVEGFGDLARSAGRRRMTAAAHASAERGAIRRGHRASRRQEAPPVSRVVKWQDVGVAELCRDHRTFEEARSLLAELA